MIDSSLQINQTRDAASNPSRPAVMLQAPSAVDSLAIVGLASGRSIDRSELTIGPHAVIRAFTVIYAGSAIGAHLETGHNAVIREENQIGDYVNIWNNSTIDYGCVVGCHVRIHCNVYVAQFTTLEDEVFLAPGVMIANDPHPLCRLHLDGPTIQRGARVGINATILPGVVIGRDALVGAGAVVTRNVPSGAIVVGNPARVIGTVDKFECPERLLHASSGHTEAVTFPPL
jgi:acetyltransferase-like isoleucine patch superfamily enzyme